MKKIWVQVGCMTYKELVVYQLFLEQCDRIVIRQQRENMVFQYKKHLTDAQTNVFEFTNETPTMNMKLTKENGSTSFECTLSFYLPLMMKQNSTNYKIF